MKVVTTGSRDWRDRQVIMEALLRLPIYSTVIHGGCRGADALVDYTAKSLGLTVVEVPAEWRLGRKAGPLRNRKMLDMSPDKVIAFCLNSSPGTMDCVMEAMVRGIEVELHENNNRIA